MYIGYDFTSLDKVFEKLYILYKNPYEGNVNVENKSVNDMFLTQDITKELNKFFTDSYCTTTLVTGGDTGFFGIKVMPMLGDYSVKRLLFSNDVERISEYAVEIDKKLICMMPELTPKELTALLINEVARVVNDSVPVEKCRDYVAQYMVAANTTLKMCDRILGVLSVGISDYISKYNSLFYLSMDNMEDYTKLVNIEFANSYNLMKKLESAIPKINQSGMKIYTGNSNSTAVIVFSWCMQVYLNFKYKRIAALRAVENCVKLSSSTLEKRNFKKLEIFVREVDDRELIYEGVYDAASAKVRKMRGSTIKSLSDDYYEIAMQARNVEDEDDALYLMRQINSRMSILGEYLEGDLDDKDRKECQNAYDKYSKIREDLAKTQTYKRSTTAIYVNYPVVQDKRFS